MRLPLGAAACIPRWTLVAFALVALAPGLAPLHAHEGHDRAEKSAAEAGSLASPRVVAVSESYQLVGIVEGEVLVVYLDRAADNAPVTTATIEISLNGQPHKAEPQSNGTYEITAPILKLAGQIEVLVAIAEAGTSDLLVGALTIAPSAANATKATRTAIGERLLVAGAVAGLALLGLVGFRRWRRGAASAVLLAALLASILAAAALAHEGHDHGADL